MGHFVTGEEDPWEPIAKGRAYAEFAAVEEFIALPGTLYVDIV